ncbi:MAG: hypothetical protein U0805_15045 [Pirellulales bacterium]
MQCNKHVTVARQNIEKSEDCQSIAFTIALRRAANAVARREAH